MVSLYHDTMPPRPRAAPVGRSRPARPVRTSSTQPLIDGGYLLWDSPEEVCEQLQPFVDYGASQACFGLPGDATSYEEALATHRDLRHLGCLIPEFDKAPRGLHGPLPAQAKPKFPTFNREPLASPPCTTHPSEGRLWATIVSRLALRSVGDEGGVEPGRAPARAAAPRPRARRHTLVSSTTSDDRSVARRGRRPAPLHPHPGPRARRATHRWSGRFPAATGRGDQQYD